MIEVAGVDKVYGNGKLQCSPLRESISVVAGGLAAVVDPGAGNAEARPLVAIERAYAP